MIANETGLPVRGLSLSANNKDLPDCFELKQLRDLGESSDNAISLCLSVKPLINLEASDSIKIKGNLRVTKSMKTCVQ